MHLDNGIRFLASEFIPGDDTNIYAYTGYRSRQGQILNEWTGKKLNQYPGLFGVFSSASNEAPEIVREQGRKLLDGMNIFGIAEPEFKFDHRNGKYKLMEINLRSMMWHRTGNLSGVNLQFTQWCDATNQPIQIQTQRKNPPVHFIYMKHEILNLLSRRKYKESFFKNVMNVPRREFAVFDKSDLKPFFHDLLSYPRSIASLCLKPFCNRFGRKYKR
jgi:predicted ATP-grasp superfamily ATP-dependent carboligase